MLWAWRPSVQSVTLVNCDHIVQQKWTSVRDRIGWCPACRSIISCDPEFYWHRPVGCGKCGALHPVYMLSFLVSVATGFVHMYGQRYWHHSRATARSYGNDWCIRLCSRRKDRNCWGDFVTILEIDHITDGFQTISCLTDCNFIIRMLYCDAR